MLQASLFLQFKNILKSFSENEVVTFVVTHVYGEQLINILLQLFLMYWK